MAFLGDFGRAFEKGGKKAREGAQGAFDAAGRGLGRIGSKLGSDETGQFFEGAAQGFGGIFTGDLGKLKSGSRFAGGGVTALTTNLFASDEPLDENPDVGDPFVQEGRQSARDPRNRRGGGTGTILTSNSQSPSLLG